MKLDLIDKAFLVFLVAMCGAVAGILPPLVVMAWRLALS